MPLSISCQGLETVFFLSLELQNCSIYLLTFSLNLLPLSLLPRSCFYSTQPTWQVCKAFPKNLIVPSVFLIWHSSQKHWKCFCFQRTASAASAADVWALSSYNVLSVDVGLSGCCCCLDLSRTRIWLHCHRKDECIASQVLLQAELGWVRLVNFNIGRYNLFFVSTKPTSHTHTVLVSSLFNESIS